MLTSIIFGVLYLAALFLLCFIVAAGIRSVILSVRLLIKPKKPVKTEPPPPKKVRKPVRSIEINPDEVDRIYVRRG